MTHTALFIRLPYAAMHVDFAALRGQAARWWRGLSAQERYPVWLGAVGMVLIVGMLVAFHQIVSGAVHQGDKRRVATSAQLAATLRCADLPGRVAQDACRGQSGAAGSATTLIAMR